MLFPCLTVFIIFLLYLAYLRGKSSKESDERTRVFWEKENLSNQTRRQDISNLDYIKVSLEELPLGQCTTSYCKKLEGQITDMATRPILNLNGLSNTDLKLKYGAANLPALSEYDQSFTQLNTLLYQYGRELHEQGFSAQAIQVLEYAISIHADMSKLFILLGSIYQEAHNSAGIETLIQKTSYLSPLLKDATVTQLKTFL